MGVIYLKDISRLWESALMRVNTKQRCSHINVAQRIKVGVVVTAKQEPLIFSALSNCLLMVMISTVLKVRLQY